MKTANKWGMALAVWYIAVASSTIFSLPNLVINASAETLKPWHLASAVMACIVGILTLLITSRGK